MGKREQTPKRLWSSLYWSTTARTNLLIWSRAFASTCDFVRLFRVPSGQKTHFLITISTLETPAFSAHLVYIRAFNMVNRIVLVENLENRKWYYYILCEINYRNWAFYSPTGSRCNKKKMHKFLSFSDQGLNCALTAQPSAVNGANCSANYKLFRRETGQRGRACLPIAQLIIQITRYVNTE